MSRPKRIIELTAIDDGETVRLIAQQQSRIGGVWITIYGQSRDIISLPQDDEDQWRRDMAVSFLEGL